MKNKKWHPMLRVTLIALAVVAVSAAQAQSYPQKPVSFVIGLGAGSSSDIILRIIGQELTQLWGQTAIIENRPGAAGNIAANFVSNARRDGFTLLFSNSGIAIAHSYYRTLQYNALTDFAPVSLAISMPYIVCVNPSLPVKSTKDLIALAKSRPGELLFSSSGNGQTGHMAGEMFAYMAGVRMTHVAYKGGAQAITAVISGEVALQFPGLPVALPHVKAGKVRAIAVTTSNRAPSVPEIPTVAESGVPNYEQSNWSGVFAPSGVPPLIIEKLSDDFARVLKLGVVQKRLAENGVAPIGSTPAQFNEFYRAEIERWSQLVKATGIRSN